MKEKGRYSPLFPFTFTLLPCLQLVLASGNSTLGQVPYIYHPVILVENTGSLPKKNKFRIFFLLCPHPINIQQWSHSLVFSPPNAITTAEVLVKSWF